MQPSLLVRLRPRGPWRYGPGEGGHDQVDSLYRSDRLFSAVTLALKSLGAMEDWLDETVRSSSPAVTFSSLFPFQAETLFAAPPTITWPPPPHLVTSTSPVFLTKLRWQAARFIPLPAIDSLLAGQPLLADQWTPDLESGCLLRRDRPSISPFRTVVRGGAAVDRLTYQSDEGNTRACVEFEPASGLWTLARFRNNEAESAWAERLRAAFRLLADSGLGGGRTRGWGLTQSPEFQTGVWPELLFPKVSRLTSPSTATASMYWLLSLYSPASGDRIDWSGGDYQLTLRSGRIDSTAAAGGLKKVVRMVAEGSVLAAVEEPVGAAPDVAPDGFAHPVYRSGLALALKLPEPRLSVADVRPVEESLGEESLAQESVSEEEFDVEPPAPLIAPEDRLPDPFENSEAHEVVTPDPEPPSEVEP